VELELHTQTEMSRRRYRALVGHLPIACNFQFVEVDMRPHVSRQSIRPYMQDIQRRFLRRKKLRDQRHMERHLQDTASHRKGMDTDLADVAAFPAANSVVNSGLDGTSSSATLVSVPECDSNPRTKLYAEPSAAHPVPEIRDLPSTAPCSLPGSLPSSAFPLLESSPKRVSDPAPAAWGRSPSLTGTSPPTGSRIPGSHPSFRDALKAPPKKEVWEIPANATVKKTAKGTSIVLFSSAPKRSYR